MLEVTAQRRSGYQTFSYEVKVNGFDKLTPRAARAALEIAFGNSLYGTVWAKDYGYVVYAKSARKVYPEPEALAGLNY